jgi:cobalt-zinc-cadmium efflux system protein
VAIQTLPGVKDVHHLHAWTLTSKKNVFSAHVRTENVEKAPVLLDKIHTMLREKFGFYFSTVQIEDRCLDEDHAREIEISEQFRVPERRQRF